MSVFIRGRQMIHRFIKDTNQVNTITSSHPQRWYQCKYAREVNIDLASASTSLANSAKLVVLAHTVSELSSEPIRFSSPEIKDTLTYIQLSHSIFPFF